MPCFSLRSSARLVVFACSFTTLHCSDDVLILEQPPAAADEPTAEPGASDIVTPGAGGSASPAPDEAGASGTPREPGSSAGGAPPSNEPSSGGATGAECQPRGVGGPFWLTEGDAIQIPIECASGAPLAADDVRFSNLPDNAGFDAATHTLSFAPGLDQAGSYTLDIGLAGTSEHASLVLEVADRFDAPGNVPVDPATYARELGLPVLHLTTDPGINEDSYLPATITYKGHAFSGAEAKYRGTTALGYPKKSFTLKFTKEDRFGDTERAPGFTDKRKITLTSTFDDITNLRARLALELWNRLDDGQVKVLAYNAVLYLNGQFWGIYTVTDHVDGRLMEDYGLYQEGNLYKARTHDANFDLTRIEDPGGAKLSLAEGYTKEEGLPLDGEPGASADLEALVSWVASSSSTAFLAELDARIVRREYEDWWLLVSLIFAGDSAGKNSYHYRDPRASAADSRFHVVPWDFNDSFGQTFYADHPGRQADSDPEELVYYNRLFARLLSEPSTREALLSRYRSQLSGGWALSSVLASFDAWAAENEPVARRDESKWGALYRAHFAALRSTPAATHGEELAYMRQWLIDRWTFVGDYYGTR